MNTPAELAVSPSTISHSGAHSVSSMPAADSATAQPNTRRAPKRQASRPAIGVATMPTR